MTDQESVGRSLLEEILGKISSLLKRDTRKGHFSVPFVDSSTRMCYLGLQQSSWDQESNQHEGKPACYGCKVKKWK